jgi:hypothetical protein
VFALLRISSVHIPQSGDFLAKSRDVFQDIRHPLNLTPDCPNGRFILRYVRRGTEPVPASLMHISEQ